MQLELTELEHELVTQALENITIKGEYARIMYPLLIKLGDLQDGTSEDTDDK